MQDRIPNSAPTDKIYLLLGAIAGAGITMATLRHFPPDQAALISAIAIAALSFLNTQIVRLLPWWVGTGAIAGIIIGLSLVIQDSLEDGAVPLEFHERLIVLGLQGIAGFISGAILGRKLHKAHVPSLNEFLRRASTLTVGLFSFVITTSFLLDGLEVARTLSSRLSVTTTVLVTALVIPGVVSYLLFELDLPVHGRHPQR